MLSELFSSFIPKAQAEEQPAQEEKDSTENKGEGEGKEEEPAEEEEPEDVRYGSFDLFGCNVELTSCLPFDVLFHCRSLAYPPTVPPWTRISWK
jgi:hypothetical protein